MGRLGNVNNDIRLIKKELRLKYRAIRSGFSKQEKNDKDAKIEKRFLDSSMYKQASTLLCFVSTELEVNTHGIIRQALIDKKTVAAPKCIDKNGTMRFYVINSFDDLEEATFGLYEPRLDKCAQLKRYTGSLCVMPGFAFDSKGYRIGFGKGYYDRFLNKVDIIKVAVCYNECIANKLPKGRYDVPADYIITPKYTLTISHSLPK